MCWINSEKSQITEESTIRFTPRNSQRSRNGERIVDSYYWPCVTKIGREARDSSDIISANLNGRSIDGDRWVWSALGIHRVPYEFWKVGTWKPAVNARSTDSRFFRNWRTPLNIGLQISLKLTATSGCRESAWSWKTHLITDKGISTLNLRFLRRKHHCFVNSVDSPDNWRNYFLLHISKTNHCS